MNLSAVNAIPIDRLNAELDKAGGSWILTAFPHTAPTIGLRIRTFDYNLLGEPFTVRCELRPAGRTEFQTVFVFTTAGFDSPCEHLADWGNVPLACRRAFLALYRQLRKILLIVELASCSEERYPNEPISSRDHLRFGPADDLPNPMPPDGGITNEPPTPESPRRMRHDTAPERITGCPASGR